VSVNDTTWKMLASCHLNNINITLLSHAYWYKQLIFYSPLANMYCDLGVYFFSEICALLHHCGSLTSCTVHFLLQCLLQYIKVISDFYNNIIVTWQILWAVPWHRQFVAFSPRPVSVPFVMDKWHNYRACSQ